MKIVNPTGDPDCRKSQYMVAFEECRVEDIHFDYPRAAFEKVCALSEFNEDIYRAFVSPWVQAAATPWGAELMKWLHPMRMRGYLFSEKFSPWMAGVEWFAELARTHRQRAEQNNPFFASERAASQLISGALEGYQKARDRAAEHIFALLYE
jgi:hypothetical protein